jgi:tRNA nucleotidyltransferase (CCA-adding enzyme)
VSPSRAAALRDRLWRGLGEQAEPLRAVAAAAAEQGAETYLVGGPVRDLLLDREARDLDVMVSDHLEAIARATAKTLAGKLTLRAGFLTATVWSEAFRLDLSRARSERYPRPGALPEVAAGTVRQDLARRDFAVNAIALPLTGDGGLLDPEHGRRDLTERQLRVLHAESFRDDPTRLFRAARYSARLGFRLEPGTRRLARDAVDGGAVETISGDRVRHELEHLIDEAQPALGARAHERLGLFEATAPGWHVAEARPLRRFAAASSRPPWPEAADPDTRRAAGLRLLLVEATPRVRQAALARLAVRGRAARAVLDDLRQVGSRLSRLERPLAPGRLDASLSELGDPALLALYCTGSGAVARQVARYALRLRPAPSPLDGHRARTLGAAGPAVGALLRASRTRALNGQPVTDAWLRRWLARNG